MTRAEMIVAVGLTAYCLLDIAMSVLVAIAWRTRAIAPIDLPPATRARRLFALRVLPAAVAGLITIAIVLPAFMMFEPAHNSEAAGPALLFLATTGLVQLIAGTATAAWSAVTTLRVERQLQRAAIDVSERDSVITMVIESPIPFLALVGLFRPTLIASASIVNACDADELRTIVAHERGHLQGCDNLRRWIMSSVPDMLRWTPIGHEIGNAWHHAAEDAADDAATGSDADRRANLAALLLKVVRLAPRHAWTQAIISPFVEDDGGLERRVRRLLKEEREKPAPLALVPVTLFGLLLAVGVAVLASPAALERIFDVVEGLVALGR